MIGIWKGCYTYSNKRVQKAVGYDKTNFLITIDSFDGRNFKGTVRDDINTGGMKEIGLIEGHIENNNVLFKKLMPQESIIIDKIGTRKLFDKKHPTLFYIGQLSNKTGQITGTWKFKIAVGFLFGFIPIPFRPGKGDWSMILQ